MIMYAIEENVRMKRLIDAYRAFKYPNGNMNNEHFDINVGSAATMSNKFYWKLFHFH